MPIVELQGSMQLVFQLITYTHAFGDVEGELHQARSPPQ